MCGLREGVGEQDTVWVGSDIKGQGTTLMPWNGDVIQEIQFVRPVESSTCEIRFCCGHTQLLNYPAVVIRNLRRTVCAQCSKPMWDKIGAIRDRINFDDVLKKLAKHMRES